MVRVCYESETIAAHGDPSDSDTHTALKSKSNVTSPAGRVSRLEPY